MSAETGADRCEWAAVRTAILAVAAVVAVAVVASAIVNAFHVPLTRLEKMRRCFEKEKGLVTTDVGNDVIAGSATRGSLSVVLLGNGVHVALAETEDEAREIRGSYLRIDPALRLRNGVDRTVVYLWDYPPSKDQQRLAADCWY